MTGDACREVGFGAGLLEMTSFRSLCARPIPENGICLLTVGDSLRQLARTVYSMSSLHI